MSGLKYKLVKVSKTTLSNSNLNCPFSYLTESKTLKSFQISLSNIHPSPSSPLTFPVISQPSFLQELRLIMPNKKIILNNVFILKLVLLFSKHKNYGKSKCYWNSLTIFCTSWSPKWRCIYNTHCFCIQIFVHSF